jgi:hypothetical protein
VLRLKRNACGVFIRKRFDDLAQTDEQIDKLADDYAKTAPELDYSRPGVFSDDCMLVSFSPREARILWSYAATHDTTPKELISSFLTELSAKV